MSKVDTIASLPRGFIFAPTDEEIVCYYLKRKIMKEPSNFDLITVIDIYKFDPWDLPTQATFGGDDSMWYFFASSDKKYGSGVRTNRATMSGYWKTTGKVREIRSNLRIVGSVRTLVFYRGRAPRGVRTNWVMHEYRLADEEVEKGVVEDWFVLCKVLLKDGPSPKYEEQYRVPVIGEYCDGIDNAVTVLTDERFEAAPQMTDDKITSISGGLRFRPTDQELVCYYLKGKIMNKASGFDLIPVVDVYKFEPWDLPAQSKLKNEDLVWYFFRSLDEKAKGSRTSRATKNGYWKVTGKDRRILSDSRIVGFKKTLLYHRGRSPRAERTDWVMHEYSIVDEVWMDAVKEWFVLCKIRKKSGPGPKTIERHGVLSVEEDRDGNNDDVSGLTRDLIVAADEMSNDDVYGVNTSRSSEGNSVCLLAHDNLEDDYEVEKWIYEESKWLEQLHDNLEDESGVSSSQSYEENNWLPLHDNLEDESRVSSSQSYEENNWPLLPDRAHRYGFNEHWHLNSYLILRKPPLRAENLVKLNLTNSLVKQLWEGKPCLVNLETMDLNLTMITKLSDLSECVKLERLNLQGCARLISALPIEHLTNLVWLNLRDCTSLVLLPSMINLKLLLTLVLSGCESLTELPELPTSIKYLRLSGAGVTELPTSIGNLSNLMELDLRNCKRLKRLPNSICKLTALENLNVSGCSSLYSF